MTPVLKPLDSFNFSKDAKKGVELAPNTSRLVSRAARLAPIAQEKQEKMKDEMLGMILSFYS